MNKTIGLQLIVYSLLLAGLSYLSHHLAPALAKPTLIAGLVGGALSLVWGLRALLGKSGKALPLLTLMPVTFVMLSQTVMSWVGGGQKVPGQRTAALAISVLFALSIGMLMRIAYAGVVFGGPPARPTRDAGAQSRTPAQPAAQANAVKRG